MFADLHSALFQDVVHVLEILLSLPQRLFAQEAHVVGRQVEQHLHVVVLTLVNGYAKLVELHKELQQTFARLKSHLRIVLSQLDLKLDWGNQVVLLVLDDSACLLVVGVSFEDVGLVLVTDPADQLFLCRLVVHAKIDDFEDFIHGDAPILFLRPIDVDTIPFVISRVEIDFLQRDA